MLAYLMVAVGGALGATGRYAVYNLALIVGVASQLATFLINVVGALLIGVLYVVITERGGLSPVAHHLWSIGFLGAFTTYSTYSLDAWQLLERGEVGMASFYLIGTMLVCVIATWCGLSLARALF